ncbi:MAG: helix-turn-helix transcriptional regulator [Oscillibacter sp.]
MDNSKSILSVKEYGRVHVCLREILDGRGMTRNELARAINARFEVVDKWYQGSVAKIDADVLARMCFVLKCEIGDILCYEEG